MVVGDFPLKQKIVAVTGGGSGIGLAFVQLAASQDNRVIIFDLSLSPEAQAWLDKDASGKATFLKGDVTKWADLRNIVAFSMSKFDDVPDVYIAGAGIFEKPTSSFWGDDESDRYLISDVNLHPIKLSRIAIRALLEKNKKGVIVIISSMAAHYQFYPVPLYNATKAALVAFTKSLLPADAEEGVKVVCICPGAVETPLWTSAFKDQWSLNQQEVQVPSEVAQAIMKLVQTGSFTGGSIMMSSKSQENFIMPAEKYWDQNATWKQAAEPVRAILAKERGGTV